MFGDELIGILTTFVTSSEFFITAIKLDQMILVYHFHRRVYGKLIQTIWMNLSLYSSMEVIDKHHLNIIDIKFYHSLVGMVADILFTL